MDEFQTTPLLDDSSAINRHRPLVRLAEANRQMPLSESGATPSGQSPQFLSGTIINVETVNEENSLSRSSQEETNDEVSLEEIVHAMCSAWQRTRKTRVIEITLDFFTTRELYAMHRAWKEITRGKYCTAVDHQIAEYLADAMATEITPIFPFPPEHLYNKTWNLAFHADKNLIAVNLLREWERITKGDDADFSILEDCDSDNQSPDESERVYGFWQRPAQLCDMIRCLIFNIRFQFLLHSLLIVWPISSLIIATKYVDCSVNQALLYLLMILGAIGCFAIVIRLILIFSTGRNLDAQELYWRWMGLRFIEFCFLIVFIMQAYRVFGTRLPTEPVSDQCVRKFYSAVLRTNYASIALLLVYLIVYANKIRLRFFQA